MNIYSVELTEDLREFLNSSPDYYIAHILASDWEHKKYVAIKTFREQVEWIVTDKGRSMPYQFMVKACNKPQGPLISYGDFMALHIMPTEEARTEYLLECRRQYKASLVMCTPCTE